MNGRQSVRHVIVPAKRSKLARLARSCLHPKQYSCCQSKKQGWTLPVDAGGSERSRVRKSCRSGQVSNTNGTTLAWLVVPGRSRSLLHFPSLTLTWIGSTSTDTIRHRGLIKSVFGLYKHLFLSTSTTFFSTNINNFNSTTLQQNNFNSNPIVKHVFHR